MSKFQDIINFAEENPKLIQVGFDTAYSLIRTGMDLVDLISSGDLTEEELEVLVEKYSAEKDEAIEIMKQSIRDRKAEEAAEESDE